MRTGRCLATLQGLAIIGILIQCACGGKGVPTGTGSDGTPTSSVSVSLSVGPTDITSGDTLAVTAQVLGSINTAVTWAVDSFPNGDATVGTISGSGNTITYIAPANEGSYELIATSLKDSTKSARASMTVRHHSTISSVLVVPAIWTLNVGTQKQFAATVAGTGSHNSGVTWSAQRGSITSGGLYTAPATSGNDVVTATSLQDSTKTAISSVTVAAAPSTISAVAVSPTTFTLNVGTQRQLTATVTGTGSFNSGVTWSAQRGTITSGGLYTAPATSGNDVVTATSQQDSTKTAVSSATVAAVPSTISSVAVSPTTFTLNVGTQRQLAATVTGTGSFNSGVTWSAQRGTITSGGLYTAPATSGNDVVTATSLQDSTKTAVSSATVATVPSTISSVAVSPATLTLDTNAQGQFAATVTGTGSYNSGVTWSAQRGSITSGGLYTAPSTGGNDVVIAASIQVPSVTSSVTVVVKGTPSSLLPTWTGTGRTISVAAGADIQAAINSASAGDTITLANGTWMGVHLTINKKLRLNALSPLGARLQGNSQPTEGSDSDSGITITGSAAAGTFVQDLDIRWYGGHSIGVEESGGTVISGCHLEGNGSQGIFLWDSVDVFIFGNSFFDPYSSGMVPTLVDQTSNANWTANTYLASMDYGVQGYGTVRTQVVQNYFYGQFCQVVSFKEGNRDYSVKENTFEGFAGTAVLFGQNVAHYGPYSYSGQPSSLDTGTLNIEGNIFRPIVGLYFGNLAEYRGRSPIRLGHLNQATVYATGNIIEGAMTGLSVEMGINASSGGPSGTLYADHNIINGNLWDDGTMVSPTGIRAIGGRAIQIDSGVDMNVVIKNDTYANFDCAIEGGTTSMLTIDRTIFINNSTTISGSGVVTNSIFYPNSALSGAGNVTANPQINTAIVPLRRYNPNIFTPTSDLTTRFHPGSSSPAKLSDGTFAGAIAP